tara:strand:- start:1130 stop:2623 length:1494 start_codon:yes stop_codon:yes gene_type:complete
MTIEVTTPRPTEEEILAYRLEQERGDQELGIYNSLLEDANKKGRSFAGHLNKLDAAGILEGPAGNRYDLFMKKYEQDMEYQRRFGDQLQKERRSGKTKNDEDMDPFVLEELIKQRKILDNLEQQRFINPREKSFRGMPSGEYTRLANGGSPEQELVNQRIAELMMEEPVNEMRATNPDMFERQKLGIERLLSNLYEPRRSRDIAETISTAVDFSPAGIPTAVAEGIRMMGDDQPLMGAGMVALGVSPFKGLSKVQLQKAYQKLQKELTETIEDIKYRAQSYRKSFNETGNKGDGFDADRFDAMARRMEKRNLREQDEVKELLKQGEIGFDDDDYVLAIDEIMAREGIDDPAEAAVRLKALQKGSKDPEALYEHMSRQRRLGVPASKEVKDTLQEMTRKKARDEELIKKGLIPPLTQTERRNQPKQVKGIINATPETQKLYQELLDSPSAINTPRHNKVGKDASEQLREIKKQVEESDLEDRNEVLRLLAQLRDKKPK